MKYIILLLFLTVSVSAYYPGESIIINNTLNSDNIVYTIANNQTPINIDFQVGTETIRIILPQDMPPTLFDIIIIEQQTKEVIKTINVGGGSSTQTIYKPINQTKVVYVPNNTIELNEVVVPEYVNVSVPAEPELFKRSIILFACFFVALLLVVLLFKIISYLSNRAVDDDNL